MTQETLAFQLPGWVGLRTSSSILLCRSHYESVTLEQRKQGAKVYATLQAPLETKPPLTMAPQKVNLKAILFDLDGTCVNSDHIHYEAYRDTLLDLAPEFNNGLPISRTFYDQEMSGRQNPQLVANILPNFSLPEQTTLWQTKEQRYEDVITRGVPPIPGLLEIINWCKSNNLIFYVVTNAPKGSCQKTMKAIGILEYFGANVVVAEECEHPKPHPAPYLRALQLAGVKASEAIAFEDSPSGTKSATSAGILTIGIRSTQSDAALRSAGAAFTIADYTSKDLRIALENWLS